MKKLERTCWQCGKKLYENHANVETPNGKVKVHFTCVESTKMQFTYMPYPERGPFIRDDEYASVTTHRDKP